MSPGSNSLYGILGIEPDKRIPGIKYSLANSENRGTLFGGVDSGKSILRMRKMYILSKHREFSLKSFYKDEAMIMASEVYRNGSLLNLPIPPTLLDPKGKNGRANLSLPQSSIFVINVDDVSDDDKEVCVITSQARSAKNPLAVLWVGCYWLKTSQISRGPLIVNQQVPNLYT